jgi:hypothetical protein
MQRNSRSCIEKYDAGSVIIRQGDLGEDAYKIVDGEVQVVVKMADGRKKTVATLQAGDTFGEIAQNAESHRRTATCIAKHKVILEVFSPAKISQSLDRGLEGLEIDVQVQTDSEGSESEEEKEGEDRDEEDDRMQGEGAKEEDAEEKEEEEEGKTNEEDLCEEIVSATAYTLQVELEDIRAEQESQRAMLQRIEIALGSLLVRHKG